MKNIKNWATASLLISFIAVIIAMLNLVAHKAEGQTTIELPKLASSYKADTLAKYAYGPEVLTSTTYTIRKGAHFCDQSIPRMVPDGPVYYRVLFDKSCMYDLGDSAKNKLTNKLTGLSYWTNNHIDNIRLGWSLNARHDSIVMRLYTYSHLVKDKKTGAIAPVSKILFSVAAGQEFDIGYIPNREKDSIIVVSNKLSKPRAFFYQFDGMPAYGWVQYPYFGGSYPAPHDMKITLTQIPAFK